MTLADHREHIELNTRKSLKVDEQLITLNRKKGNLWNPSVTESSKEKVHNGKIDHREN